MSERWKLVLLVVAFGRVPSAAEITTMITTAAAMA